MPTNEAGLSEGHDLGAGGGVTASDMPAGEENMDAQDKTEAARPEPVEPDDLQD